MHNFRQPNQRFGASVVFFCKKKVTKENHLDLRSKDPLARGGFRRRGGEQVLRLRAQAGAFRAPARVPFFFCKKKGTKENHLDLRSKDPLARYGSCRFGGAGFAELERRGTLSVRGIACTACAATADNSEGRGWCADRVAIIKSRLCRLAAAKVGVPVGHGYNYFLACDTAERIIFAVVAGSGSGKLCWHSRGNDNDQENAGCVRESAGGSEQALRLRARDGEFRAPARVTFFFCKKKVTKENHLDLRSKGPLARGGQVQIWRC